MIAQLQQEITKLVTAYLQERGVNESSVQLERTANPEFGEYSLNVAMKYAKQLQQNPFEVAATIAQAIESVAVAGVQKVEAVRPGFINIYLTPEAKLQHVQVILKASANFGASVSLKGQKWVIEHTSPNPNKAMHLGHLRNNLVGMGLVRLLKNAGAEVVSDCVYNDRGIAIAKVMYGYLAFMKKSEDTPTDITHWIEHPANWFTPEEKQLSPDSFVETCYVQAEVDFKANPDVEQMVRQFVVDWEAGTESVWQLWRQVLEYAYAGQAKTLKRLGSYWDKVWYEHEHYQKGKDYVEQGLQAGVFQKLEDGAVISQLEEQYQLPDTVLLKSDGTSLYITQDLALTDLKKNTYDADKLVWVVGNEQAMAFKQLFACCEQLGVGKREDFSHVSYGYVALKSAEKGAYKMSSRAGTVVLIDDVIDGVKTTILQRFAEDGKTDGEVRAEKLALAAVKFAFLKSDRTQDMTFDVEQSVDIQGDSGMYVMYSYVRSQSILRKAGSPVAAGVIVPKDLGAEAEVVRTLLYFGAMLEKSVDDLSVHHVAQYLLELSSAFNSWYAKETFLDGTSAEAYRLSIVEAVGIALQNGLVLLGIETVDEI